MVVRKWYGVRQLTTEQIELVGPEEGGDWKVQNRWFVMQSGFVVRLRKRNQETGKAAN